MFELSRWPHWARWLLAIPLAAAAFVAVQWVVAVLSIFDPLPKSWSDIWAQLVNSAISPTALVYVAARIVPRHAFAMAISMALFYACSSVVVFLMGYAYKIDESASVPWLILTFVLGLIGAAVACVLIHERAMEGQKRDVGANLAKVASPFPDRMSAASQTNCPAAFPLRSPPFSAPLRWV